MNSCYIESIYIFKNNKISLEFLCIKNPYRVFILFKDLHNKKRLRGYVLLSQAVAHQVPSALKSLTSVFGMGTGVSSLL